MNLNHLHLASAQPEKTMAFYGAYFGFQLRRKLNQTAVLQNDAGFILAIDEAAGTEGSGGDKLHFGFALSDAKEVESLFDRMTRDGVPFQATLQRRGENAVHFYCWDPAGHLLEVGWYKL